MGSTKDRGPLRFKHVIIDAKVRRIHVPLARFRADRATFRMGS